LGLGV
jgi:hypothetical protein